MNNDEMKKRIISAIVKCKNDNDEIARSTKLNYENRGCFIFDLIDKWVAEDISRSLEEILESLKVESSDLSCVVAISSIDGKIKEYSDKACFNNTNVSEDAWLQGTIEAQGSDAAVDTLEELKRGVMQIIKEVQTKTSNDKEVK